MFQRNRILLGRICKIFNANSKEGEIKLFEETSEKFTYFSNFSEILETLQKLRVPIRFRLKYVHFTIRSTSCLATLYGNFEVLIFHVILTIILLH